MKGLFFAGRFKKVGISSKPNITRRKGKEMLDYSIMIGLLLFLSATLVFQCKYKADGNTSFFDIRNTQAMRGFWCIIVVLVHVPYEYQNRIQDMIGSFAYIGVTFFFMTSAYGLSLSMKKKNNVQKFWRKRLPKLVFPNWVVNAILGIIAFVIFSSVPHIQNLITINGWVRWLLACYIFFWVSCFFFKTEKLRNISIIFMVILFSVVIYVMKMAGKIESTTWTTEVYGFVWGILLCQYFEDIKKILQNHWLGLVPASMMSSLIAGVLYLKFKPVVFWGDYLLKIVLGLFIISFILALNSKIQIGNKVSMFLGEISYEVYLIHGEIFYFVSILYPQISSGVFILVSIILTVLLSVIVHRLSKVLLSACSF